MTDSSPTLPAYDGPGAMGHRRRSLSADYIKNENAGHVFVIHGDLSKLACDAWMLPTDDKLVLESSWCIKDLVKPPESPPSGWSNHGKRVLKVQDYDTSISQPWLVNVGGIKLPVCDLCGEAGAIVHCLDDKARLCAKCDGSVHSANKIAQRHQRRGVDDLQWYVEGALLFLEAVAADVKGTTPKNGRAKHLVALPLVGTGKGGAFHSAGGIVVALIPELYAAANRLEFDIALVTIRRSTFAAIQLERNRFAQEQRIWEEALGESLRSEAHRLASLAREGKLVLFLGSGVSAGAGLPTWRQLLLQLAQVAQMPEEEMALIDKMSFLDSARVIEMRLGGWKNLSHAIATRVQVSTYSLLCGLLAGLPVHEIVTTNYNQMFELSSRGVGLNVSVLPYYPIENCDRWILKMHGCVTHPEDIVLTREHYMRYQSTRSALSGIVQSLLITRHMLFVGFSLQDDNFHRIADEVRRSLRTISETESAAASSSSQTYTSGGHQEAPIVANLASPGIGDSNRPSESSSTAGLQLNYSASHSMRFGTQLYLISEPVTEILWKQDLNLVAMEKRANSSPAQAARRLEVRLHTRGSFWFYRF
eukprot:TRINITY_DN1202_c0_g1_i21.p1 TRINITY_DN1202_c0_g1~~TRINITY_DN1202_c0_g1_i21.p1  ORF type:complete len:610 (-),score=26.85 TRINITY_DN1202_c0_g1_i21:942-2711(-)